MRDPIGVMGALFRAYGPVVSLAHGARPCLHGERLAVARARLPVPIWQAIYLMSLLSLSLVGYQNGLNGNRSLIATTVLVLMFTAVLELITDLDRPQAGLLQVSQQALIDLQRQLLGGP